MSFQDISTKGLRYIVGELEKIQNSEQHDDLVNRCKAEVEKRDRMTEGGQVKDEKFSRLDEMPYGKYVGCKFTGIPVAYLTEEAERIAKITSPTDEEKKVLATIKHTLAWKARKPPITKMPFGKHKDQPFDEIPVGYLKWLKNNAAQPGGRPLDEDLASAMQASIDRRPNEE